MLANLPPKRATRKIICFKEGGRRKNSQNIQTTITSVTHRGKFKTQPILKSIKDSEIKAANQKMKQALQHNLRTRNQLAQQNNKIQTTGSRRSPRSTTNSPKLEPKPVTKKPRKVLASKIIETNTPIGPKSKVFTRKKTRFGETIVTRLRNRLILAQKLIANDERVTRSNSGEKSKDEEKPRRLRILSRLRNLPVLKRRSQRIKEVEEEKIVEVVEEIPKQVPKPSVLELPVKVKSNIDYCIDSVVADITGHVTYKEYSNRNLVEKKPFTFHSNNSTPEKGKRKRVISTQTQSDLGSGHQSINDTINSVVGNFVETPITPVPVQKVKDSISETIEQVITKYTPRVGRKPKLVSDIKGDSVPKLVQHQNFPMPMLDAVGPPHPPNQNDLKRDSIVTIPILLPVVSHVIISAGTQLNSNLLEKIMDNSINNFQLNNLNPDQNSMLEPHYDQSDDKTGIRGGKINKAPSEEYHNYVIETPIQKLIQQRLYSSMVSQSNESLYENEEFYKPEQELPPQEQKEKPKSLMDKVFNIKSKDEPKNKLKKPIKKLNDCINMLKQKLMSSNSDETSAKLEILKIPTPKFTKPPVFSDHTIKKVIEAPFQVDHSQLDDDQTSPIDLSCSSQTRQVKPGSSQVPKPAGIQLVQPVQQVQPVQPAKSDYSIDTLIKPVELTKTLSRSVDILNIPIPRTEPKKADRFSVENLLSKPTRPIISVPDLSGLKKIDEPPPPAKSKSTLNIEQTLERVISNSLDTEVLDGTTILTNLDRTLETELKKIQDIDQNLVEPIPEPEILDNKKRGRRGRPIGSLRKKPIRENIVPEILNSAFVAPEIPILEIIPPVLETENPEQVVEPIELVRINQL